MPDRRLSAWIVIDGYCATIVLDGDDPGDPLKRLAFIEKTPRVQVPGPGIYADDDGRIVKALKGDWGGVDYWWIYGPKGNGGGCLSADGEDIPHSGACNHYGFDPESRAWCERRLMELGYQWPDMTAKEKV
jgi:hypothetical protein